MKTVGDFGEFGLIQRLTRLLPASAAVIEPIGDDCAVVRVHGKTLLLSCDMAIEGVHFLRERADGMQIGYKAAGAALSDIAAMGGAPLFALVAFACPAATPLALVESIFQGIASATSQYGVSVVGGDTTRTGQGIVIDVTVIGEQHGERYLRRRGAKPGDLLVTTGRLGDSAAGLDAQEQGFAAPELIAAHYRPQARVDEGQWLANEPSVRSLIDISDGLVQDAGHLAEDDRLGIDIRRGALPLSPALVAYCATTKRDPADFALSGGEDYELLFSLDAGKRREAIDRFHLQFQTPLTIIGEFTDRWTGVRVDGEEPLRTGFDHFRNGYPLK